MEQEMARIAAGVVTFLEGEGYRSLARRTRRNARSMPQETGELKALKKAET